MDVQNDFISGSLAISNCPAGQNGEDVSFENFSTLFHFIKKLKNIGNFLSCYTNAGFIEKGKVSYRQTFDTNPIYWAKKNILSLFFS